MLAHIRIRDMRQRNYCTNTINRRYHTCRLHITPLHNNAAQLSIPAESRQTKTRIRCLLSRTRSTYTSQQSRARDSVEPRYLYRGLRPTSPTTVQKHMVVEYTACKRRRLVLPPAHPEWRRQTVLHRDQPRAHRVSCALFAETPLPANTTG